MCSKKITPPTLAAIENRHIPWRPCFSTDHEFTTIFKLVQHINKTNVLTKFNNDWPTDVTLRVKMAPWLSYWAKNVSSRLFTCFNYIHKEKSASPPGGHVF
ncbi:hypothetical protein DPMN_088466 [Dreissena polymorpha]|uniref:Uncharacterized protein n=1 Tax=Dreissena polymorpha TaxID=45954 RepID=A0A9D4KV27_DREPO|nr:hypothetical protein DPMN_088466 [Dreissena polymorpha]